MKLVVGLGNPGRKYEETRHNIGFEVVRELGKRHAASRPRVRFQGEVCEAQIGTDAVLLLMPQTYMNRSGASVLAARDFYKLADTEVLVVCDDFHLPLAQLRARPKGSAGGQKGLADILRRLGTQDIPRLRFGIGAAPPEWDVADYVLSKFRKAEWDVIDPAIGRAADAVGVWTSEGMQACMNRFNAAANTRKKSGGKQQAPESDTVDNDKEL